MKENTFTFNKSDADKIKSATEKLYQDRDQFRGKIITWEDFWSQLLYFDLPDNDLNRHYWINIRTSFVRAINAQFAEYKYPCWLNVIYDNGVVLLIDKDAALHTSVKYTNKIINSVKLSKSILENHLESFDEPEAKHIMKTSLRFIDNTFYSIIGMVVGSKLPESSKQEIITKIQKALPSSIDD